MRLAYIPLFGLVTFIGCSSSNTNPSSSPDAPLGPAPQADAALDDATGDDADDASMMDETIPEPTCDEYCGKVMAACPGAFGQPGSSAQFPSMDGCQNLCNQIGSGDYTDMAGNDSLGCRLNQLPQGSAGCNAAGSTGAGVCNSPDDAGDNGRCQTFCSSALALCTTDNGVNPPPFADMDTCVAQCGSKFAFDPSKPEFTTSGNTLNCRQYYLVLAYDVADGASAAVYQCPHLGWPASAFCD